MGKKILCLVMTALMIAGTSASVFADNIQGNEDWKVQFDGERMNSSFNTSDVNAAVYKLLPGDSMELEIGIENTSKEKTDWYMTNEIIQSLEESQNAAEGGAYTYRLTYVNHENKETVLYSSDKVGGEGSGEAGEGLEQATDAMGDYFYLDRLGAGEAGKVHLTVALDGETQGNGYQDTLAKLQINFAVEKVTADVVYEPGDPVKITETKKVFRSGPKTGDETKIIAVCAVTLISGLILLFFGIKAIRKNRSNRKGEQ